MKWRKSHSKDLRLKLAFKFINYGTLKDWPFQERTAVAKEWVRESFNFMIVSVQRTRSLDQHNISFLKPLTHLLLKNLERITRHLWSTTKRGSISYVNDTLAWFEAGGFVATLQLLAPISINRKPSCSCCCLIPWVVSI